MTTTTAPTLEHHLMPGFTPFTLQVNGIQVHGVQHLNQGKPPLLLLHGHPQTHLIWHQVIPHLLQDFSIVATDLRGYGDSSKPVGEADHSNYSKRVMAQDQLDVMRQLGFTQFHLVGHDRGGRVAHRLAADHPTAVRTLAVLDIAPTLAMYERTNMSFARSYWHWFFLIQPAPLPERLLGADPAFYLNQLMNLRSDGVNPFHPIAMQAYLRAFSDPQTIHGICEDYRAAATIDLEHDRADRLNGIKLSCPLLAIWGEKGVVQREFDVLALWSEVANDVRGHTLPCGHYIPEEQPLALAQSLLTFLKEH